MNGEFVAIGSRLSKSQSGRLSDVGRGILAPRRIYLAAADGAPSDWGAIGELSARRLARPPRQIAGPLLPSWKKFLFQRFGRDRR